jgi:hypothetical protein
MILARDALRIWYVVFTCLGCVEIFFLFLPKKEQKLPRCVHANSRACPLFYLSPMHVPMPGLTVGGTLVLQLLYVNYQIDQSLREAGSYHNGPARYLLL